MDMVKLSRAVFLKNKIDACNNILESFRYTEIYRICTCECPSLDDKDDGQVMKDTDDILVIEKADRDDVINMVTKWRDRYKKMFEEL